MASFAASTLLTVFQKLYAAAEGVQVNKKHCKRLTERVRCIEHPLLAKAQASEQVHAMAVRVLTEITEFLLGFNAAKAMFHWCDHRSNTTALNDLSNSLTSLLGDVALIAISVQLQDERDDFEQQQIINKQQLPIAQAEEVNKRLQLDAPEDFIGFLEIDYGKLRQGRELGLGGFAVVFKSIWQGKDVAVKY
jgi:hypothetical protein